LGVLEEKKEEDRGFRRYLPHDLRRKTTTTRGEQELTTKRRGY